jgi:hypothetical protein
VVDWLEAFLSIRVHIYVRFGKWEELIALPLPTNTETYCYNTAVGYYGQGVAFAALRRIEEAENAFTEFEEAVKKVKPSRVMMNNNCLELLKIAREMLRGEIEYRKGNIGVAFEA